MRQTQECHQAIYLPPLDSRLATMSDSEAEEGDRREDDEMSEEGARKEVVDFGWSEPASKEVTGGRRMKAVKKEKKKLKGGTFGAYPAVISNPISPDTASFSPCNPGNSWSCRAAIKHVPSVPRSCPWLQLA